jgi:pimeloyl-ACP methyl ester carboxylesterase
MATLVIFIVTVIAIFLVWYATIHWRNWRAKWGAARPRTGVANYSPSQYIEIDGFKIHYVQEGRGPDLLLVHGLSSSIVCWAAVFSDLTKNYRVTALDLPGFGRSDKRLDCAYTLDTQSARLTEFVTKLKLRQPFVVAHSMGGALIAWLSKTKPDLFNKLLLIAPALNHRIVAVHPGLFTWFARSTQRFLISKALVRWMYTKRVARIIPPNIDELVEEYYRPYENNRAALETFWRHVHLLRDKRLPEGLKNMTTPTAIVLGQYDVVFPRRYLARFLKINPHINAVVVPECGHQIMEEDPAALIKEIRGFLI